MKNIRFTLSGKLTLCSILMMLTMWAALGTALVLSTAREIMDRQVYEAGYRADILSMTPYVSTYSAAFLDGELEPWYEELYRIPRPELSPLEKGPYMQFNSLTHSGRDPVFHSHIILTVQHAEGNEAGKAAGTRLVLDGMEAETLLDIQSALENYRWNGPEARDFPAVEATGRKEGHLFYVHTLTVGEDSWTNPRIYGTDTLTIPACRQGEDDYHHIRLSPGYLTKSQWELVSEVLDPTGPTYEGLAFPLPESDLMRCYSQYWVTEGLSDGSIINSNVLLVSTPLPTALQEHWGTLINLFMLVPLFGLIFARIFDHMVAAPIRKTKVDFERVARLDFRGLEGDIRRRDEIGDLNRDLRQMAAQLQTRWDDERALERRRQDFVAAASHELKTPLALMRGYTEGLQQGIGDRERYLAAMEGEIDRMNGLVLEMLEQTRLERMEQLPRQERIDLTDLIRSLLEQMAPLFEGLKLQVTLAEGLTLPGDRALLERAYGNLLSNAAKYCTPGGTVTLTLEQAPYAPRFTIENDAPPIPEEELSRLFELFYRGDRARDRSGSGMGLAIAGKIFSLHRLALRAENSPGGIRFTVCSQQSA